eukprot:EC120345.1.p1 GENE.EC120345.1~~EC120345.1.p1  ORF type:complete len:182 (+),score=31.30 EC120345.1:65-547(+)
MARLSGKFVFLVAAVVLIVAPVVLSETAAEKAQDVGPKFDASLDTFTKFFGFWKVIKRELRTPKGIVELPKPGNTTGGVYYFTRGYAAHQTDFPIIVSYSGPWKLVGHTFQINPIEVGSNISLIGTAQVRTFEFKSPDVMVTEAVSVGLISTIKKYSTGC